MDRYDRDYLVKAKKCINEVYEFYFKSPVSKKCETIMKKIDELIEIADKDIEGK